MAMTPSEIIARRRTDLGLSQAQLAERVGRAASTVRRWEGGQASPPQSLLPTLANALQVSLRDLQVAFGVEAEADVAAEESPSGPTKKPPPLEAQPPPLEEQPTVAAPAPAAPAAPAATATVASPPASRPPRRSPRRRAPTIDPAEGLSYIEDNRQRLRYWLRSALTIIAGIILLLVLMWAFGELREALADVWDLFGEDPPPVTSPGTDF